MSDDEEIMRELQEANREASWKKDVHAAWRGDLKPALERILDGDFPPPRALKDLRNLPEGRGRRKDRSYLDHLRKPIIRALVHYHQLRARGVCRKEALDAASGGSVTRKHLEGVINRGKHKWLRPLPPS